MIPARTYFERIAISPEERVIKLRTAIAGARRRLLLSLFRCNDNRIIAEIAAAASRGVTVEALLTPRASGWRRKLKDLGSLLESMGVRVRRYPRSHVKYHAKYLLADDGPAIVCSSNFTRKCLDRSCDFLLLTHDPAVTRGLESLFKADCEGSRASLPSRLIAGPESTRVEIAEILRSARRSIGIIDHRITDANMKALLEAKRRAGVRVEIFGEGDVPGMASHGKLLLVDHTFAVIGSTALSKRSLDSRRELSIVIRRSSEVERLSNFFHACREESYAAA